MQKLARVLLVDDDPITLFLHTRLLDQLEVAEQVVVAHNGLEALQILAQLGNEANAFAEPILVLLDLNMPVMNGLAFLETCHQHSSAQKSQRVIVVLTTSEHSRDLERIKALPVAVDILTKPLSRDKLATILHRHFQRLLPAPGGNAVETASTGLVNPDVGPVGKNIPLL